MIGSPPHMRGTPPGIATGVANVGITPAHAGNTSLRASVRSSSRDHPRTCGEHKIEGKSRKTDPGSPPHMRGTPAEYQPVYTLSGITPAHAGNTVKKKFCSTPPWDHPRTCGEHLIIFIRQITVWGSPPHMRGTRGQTVDSTHALRITPAHAGNTLTKQATGH